MSIKEGQPQQESVRLLNEPILSLVSLAMDLIEGTLLSYYRRCARLRLHSIPMSQDNAVHIFTTIYTAVA